MTEDDAPKEDREGQKWLDRIRQAQKREERWCRDAEAAEKAFSCGMDDTASGKVYDFNILHSNVETIVPAIYNSTPKPDIRERFRTGDKTPESMTARAVAAIYERAIAVQIDDGRLDAEVERVAQDAFCAGRGILRIRFDADETMAPGEPQFDPMTGQLAFDPETGAPMMGEPIPVVTNERLTFEAVSWRDYAEGPAMRWREVPWVAFKHTISEEEVERIRDPELRQAFASGNDPERRPILAQTPDADVFLWEIWCRDSRTVKMLIEHSGEIISTQDDPLGLPGFFPMPEPVQPIGVTGKRTPVCPFSAYRKLADELETITRRINAITSGLKVRGLIVGDAASLEALATAGDNELVPIANLEGLAQTGGLDKAITWWPIETAIRVLAELYRSREATKAMIYEINGISDIVRGASAASETATAQQIKTHWGSLRIRKMQRLIERLVRNVFVLSAEIIGTKFSPESLSRMTGLPIPPGGEQMLEAPLDHYRIDVESDSTVRGDMMGKRDEMGAFLQGTGAFFQVMGPLMAKAPQIAQPVIDLYAAFARQFSLGKQAEDALEMLSQAAQQAGQPQPNPPPPDPNIERERQIKSRELDVKELQAVTGLQREKMKAMQPQTIQGGFNG